MSVLILLLIRAFTFCSSTLLLLSDRMLFKIEQILSVGAVVPTVGPVA